MVRRKFSVTFLLVVCLALLAAVPAVAEQPPPSPTPQSALASLEQAAGGTLQIEWEDPAGGPPRWISGQIPVESTDPEQSARAFFARYAALYSMKDPNRELRLARAESDELGMQHLRFDQVLNGVPVFGGQLVVHLRGRFITAVHGRYFPNIQVDTSPHLSEEDALAIARQDVGDDQAEFRANRSGLVIYVADGQPHLTWKINLFSWKNLGDWLYFIDAHDGQIVHQLNQLDAAKVIRVYTANNGTSLPGTIVCGAGTADPNCTVTADLDARSAFANISKAYDYYYGTFGRDSYDGHGTPLVSTVHYGSGYRNAFWNGYQMVFGDGDKFAQAFDVVAHELTHGVIQETASLIYEHQPGALNESFADVMAVLAGCSSYTGQADCDWLLGENLNMGPVRSLSNPGAYGQPGHWSQYRWLPLEHDNGGVHINSGIPNKAAQLLIAGGTWYGIPVTGIGYARTERIYYRALTHYLTIYSGFNEARAALYASCRDLIGSYGITQSHCNQVLNAWAAVGIGTPAAPSPGPYSTYLPLILKTFPTPSTCPTTDILRNGGFEDGFAYWVISGTPETTTAIKRSGSYSALLGNGDNQDDRMIQTVTVPADAQYMQLTLYAAVASEDSTLLRYDFLYLQILDGSGNPLTPEYSVLDNTYGSGDYSQVHGWWKITLTYNEIQQRNLQVKVRATTDRSARTAFFVDDATFVTTCTRYPPGFEDLRPRGAFQLEVTPVDGPPAQISEGWNRP